MIASAIVLSILNCLTSSLTVIKKTEIILSLSPFIILVLFVYLILDVFFDKYTNEEI